MSTGSSPSPIPTESPTASESSQEDSTTTSGIGRTQTGIRIKPDPKKMAAVELTTEALRKPFASLAPPQRASTSPEETTEPTAASATRRPPETKAWNDTTDVRRRLGVCKKHGLARSPSGECLLCKKEQPRTTSKSPALLLGGIGLLLFAVIFTWLLL